MYLVFIRMPGESYRRQLRSLFLGLCDVFRALINSLVCVDSARALWTSFCFRLFSSSYKITEEQTVLGIGPCVTLIAIFPSDSFSFLLLFFFYSSNE